MTTDPYLGRIKISSADKRPMTTTADELEALAVRCERATGPDRELDEEIALALGWTTRIVTRLGLNGRTPGRKMWVPPQPPFPNKNSVPRFSGPRMRSWTVEALRTQSKKDRPNGR